MSKVMVMCDCDAGDKCPQGRSGSMNRCRIVRDERIEATIDRTPASPKPTFDLGKSDVLTSRAERLEKVIEAMQGKIEALETSVINLVSLRKILFSLLEHQGYEIGDYGKVKPKTASVAYEGVTVASKRVFKGGWVNIYLDAAGPYWMRPCCSRADADTNAAESAERRIACIQIPDITEGEGL